MAPADTDDDISDVTKTVLDDLDSGQRIGDKFILSRRQVMAVVGGTASLAGVLGLATGRAEAQQGAGKVGTESNPVDVDASSINGGGPIIDGDGTERELYLIANGASDPAGAGADDLIFEATQ